MTWYLVNSQCLDTVGSLFVSSFGLGIAEVVLGHHVSSLKVLVCKFIQGFKRFGHFTVYMWLF